MEKYLEAGDLAKIACNNCQGCHACCTGMGQSIVLSPLDIYRFEAGLDMTFEQLLASYIELHVEDGVILPNMKMQERTEACGLLDENGRCSAHAFRPGLCRLFPLGRNYENNTFQYFVVEGACPHPQKSKVKISKWLEEPNLRQNEQFIAEWHYFIKDMKNVVQWTTDKPECAKKINMLILQEFYMNPYDITQDFYEQYRQRKEYVEEQLKTLAD